MSRNSTIGLASAARRAITPAIITIYFCINAAEAQDTPVFHAQFSASDHIQIPQRADAGTVSTAVTNYQPLHQMTNASPSVVLASATRVSNDQVYTSFNHSSQGRLREVLSLAKEQWKQDRLPPLQPARLELENALESLEKFVQVGTSNGDKWSKFLRLADVKEQLHSDKPSYTRLLDLEMNMRQNYLGLEYNQFTRLRDALVRYGYASRFHAQEEGFSRFVSKQIDDAISLLSDESSLNSAAIAEVGNILSTLHQANQEPEVISKLRGLFGQPNARLYVKENFVDRLVSRAVAQPQDVDECILGTRVLGTAWMNGDVSANLLPMTSGVALQLNLSACMTSQSRGYNRGVVLNTTSVSPVFATKQMFVTSTSVTGAPAQVTTQLESTINSIEHRSRLVRRIASRKAAQQKPQADAVAEGRLQERICKEFEQQASEQISQANQQLSKMQQPRPELTRVGIQRPKLDFNSTTALVSAHTIQAADYQLAAPSDCPLPQPADAGLLAQIHQSAITNALDSVMAGRTLRSRELGDFVKQITGKEPEEEMKKEIEGEEWSITFNPYQPVRIEFDDNLLKITLRLIQMTREKQSIRDPVSISTAYTPSFDGSVLTLNRQAEVSVTSDRDTTGVQATAMRAFIKTKFDKTFREQIATQPIDLKSRFPRAANLNIDLKQLTFQIDDGWLQVALP